MIKKLSLIFFIISMNANALTFKEAIQKLEKHESVESALYKSKATIEVAESKGSWGDPMLKIAAKNYPVDTLKNDQSPMTGIEFGISQKFSLTTKYGNIEDAFLSLSKAYKYDATDRKELLTKALWEIIILKKQMKEELKILKENQIWINKTLKVSKKLYANGKTSQQAILDIQIRKSELESEVNNKGFELDQLSDKVNYLIGSSEIIDSSIPWKILTDSPKKLIDNRELSLKEKLKSKEYSLSAAKLNYVPDVTFSLGVTKRSNIDDNGDFVGAAISFPIPLSSEKYANTGAASQERYMAIKDYDNYQKSKARDIAILEKEIEKLKTEIKILDAKTIKFARNSRTITSKSYGLGETSYIEVLQSELKLQKILIQKVMLEAKRDINRVTLKYVLGEPLNE